MKKKIICVRRDETEPEILVNHNTQKFMIDLTIIFNSVATSIL